MTQYDITALKSLLDKPQKIVITTHTKPDGDAMGSSLGLYHYLKLKGHAVSVITPNAYPENLHWLPGHDDVLILKKSTRPIIEEKFSQSDLLFCLDLSVAKQLPDIFELFDKSTAVKIIIDHHIGPEMTADHIFWNTDAAATAQIIYDLIVSMGDEDLINQDIAHCLYTGIHTDTGRFKHPNTNGEVLKIAAELCEKGADPAIISQHISGNKSFKSVQFLGFLLSERLVVLKEFNTAYIYISPKDFATYKTNSDDVKNIVNYALSIKNIRFAVQMIDLGNKVKFSFRSRGDFSVRDFAVKHYDGGGHHNASGGSVADDLTKAREDFEKLLPIYKEDLTR